MGCRNWECFDNCGNANSTSLFMNSRDRIVSVNEINADLHAAIDCSLRQCGIIVLRDISFKAIVFKGPIYEEKSADSWRHRDVGTHAV